MKNSVVSEEQEFKKNLAEAMEKERPQIRNWRFPFGLWSLGSYQSESNWNLEELKWVI